MINFTKEWELTFATPDQDQTDDSSDDDSSGS